MTRSSLLEIAFDFANCRSPIAEQEGLKQCEIGIAFVGESQGEPFANAGTRRIHDWRAGRRKNVHIARPAHLHTGENALRAVKGGPIKLPRIHRLLRTFKHAGDLHALAGGDSRLIVTEIKLDISTGRFPSIICLDGHNPCFSRCGWKRALAGVGDDSRRLREL